jgi:hypothetical protein
MDLQGHVKQVRPMDHERIMEDFMSEGERTRIRQLIEKIGTKVKKHSRTFTVLREDDVELLLRAKYIIKVSRSPTINVFRVAERHKMRARIICWPKDCNDQMDYDADLELTDPVDLVRAVLPNCHVLTFDLTISFYQVRLPPHIAQSLVFEFRGSRYQFQVMPT